MVWCLDCSLWGQDYCKDSKSYPEKRKDSPITFETVIIIIYPLTVRVVGAPQMILQLVFSIFSLSSTALWDLLNSRPGHFLMLSSHLFLCLPCLLPPFTVPCKMVLARPDEWETWPYHCILHPLYDCQVFVWSNCLLDLGTGFFIGNMVFVWDV